MRGRLLELRGHALRPSSSSTSKLGGDTSRIGLAALAVGLVAFFEVTSGGFATFDNLDSILLNSFPLLVVGIAAAALLISGNVDLSIGGMFAMVSVVTALVARDTGSGVLAVTVALVVGLALGLANGYMVKLLSISPLIVTLGTALVLRGVAYVLSQGSAIFSFPPSFTDFGRTYILDVPMQVWVALATFLLIGLLLTRTVFGVRTYAIGGNRQAALLNGINVDRHVTSLYGLSGLAVALAACLTTAQLGSGTANIAVSFELDVLTAVILGGVGFAGGSGRPIGVFIGVVTIGVLDAGMIYAGLEDYYQQIAKGAVLLLALGADQLAGVRRMRAVKRAGPMGDSPPPPERAVGPVARETRKAIGSGEVVLSCENVTKQYGGVVAVRNVDLAARAGEVTALLGDNGAGKSTLIKIITGVVEPDHGAIRLKGRSLSPLSPGVARKAGIATVYQELALAPNLGAAYNLTLGAEPRKGRLGLLSLIDRKRCVEIASQRLERLGATIGDLFRPVGSLSGGQRQSVAIARVADENVSLVILDEPTASLGVTQSANVLGLTRSLAMQGAAVVMISHDLESVLAVADRVSVLRLGEVVHDGPIDDVTESDLLHLMAGHSPRAVRSTVT